MLNSFAFPLSLKPTTCPQRPNSARFANPCGNAERNSGDIRTVCEAAVSEPSPLNRLFDSHVDVNAFSDVYNEDGERNNRFGKTGRVFLYDDQTG